MCHPVVVVLVTFVPAIMNFNSEAIREARAREQARGAQGPRDPGQARGGERWEGKGGEGQRARGQVELMMLFSLLAAD